MTRELYCTKKDCEAYTEWKKENTNWRILGIISVTKGEQDIYSCKILKDLSESQGLEEVIDTCELLEKLNNGERK